MFREQQIMLSIKYFTDVQRTTNHVDYKVFYGQNVEDGTDIQRT